MQLKIKSTLLSAFCVVGLLKGQNVQNLSLQSAVALALENKPALKSLDLDAQISTARVAEIKLKKQLQVSGRADIQINPLLPASVIPIGFKMCILVLISKIVYRFNKSSSDDSRRSR